MSKQTVITQGFRILVLLGQLLCFHRTNTPVPTHEEAVNYLMSSIRCASTKMGSHSILYLTGCCCRISNLLMINISALIEAWFALGVPVQHKVLDQVQVSDVCFHS